MVTEMLMLTEALPVDAIPDLTALGVAGLSVYGLISVIRLAAKEREHDRRERARDRELREAEATASQIVGTALQQSAESLREAIAVIKAHVEERAG